MENIILVAGATGNLGMRICRELIQKNVGVRALVREGSNQEQINKLEQMGVDVFTVDYANEKELIGACNKVSCVVSTLAGLRDVIIDAQTSLLKAAIEAGVPRFIPSDFASDFTHLDVGDNRNFDLRKQFHQIIEQSPILVTSIFNGAFADILRYNIPLFNTKQQTIGYYDGKEDWKIDFTTVDDTAAFTAMAALDNVAPRYLKIASFSVSPNDLLSLSEEVKGTKYQLVNMGSMEAFSAYNKQQRLENPEGENELYPKWQQAQYLYSMFSVPPQGQDNNRYEDLTWSPVAANI